MWPKPSDLSSAFAPSVAWSQVYADYESNPLLRQGIEFCCRQFYILHRKPFILQLFASVAPLLEFTVSLLTRVLCFPFLDVRSNEPSVSTTVLDQHQHWSVQGSVGAVSF